MASNIESAKRGYELFKKGDIATLMQDLIDDHCEWISPGPKDKLPWAGRYRGKQEIGSFFEQLGKHYEFTHLIPPVMIESGDKVVVTGKTSARSRANGKWAQTEWVHVARYSAQGKLVFFQEYTDTAAHVAAMS